MKEERSKWETEKDSEVQQLLTSMRLEMEKTSTRLRAELSEERQDAETARAQMSTLKLVSVTAPPAAVPTHRSVVCFK